MHPATYGGRRPAVVRTFFNFPGSLGVMSNPLLRLFAFLDAPDGRPWVGMGGFAIFLILGAAWTAQAQVLPGVTASESGLSGEVHDVLWSDDGVHALALVEVDSGMALWLRSADGGWAPLDCECAPAAIGGDGETWLIGGADGWFGIIQPGGSMVMARSLDWPIGDVPDILALEGRMQTGWLIAVHAGGERQVHTWSGMTVSEGADAPLDSLVLTDLETVPGGALILGHDLAGGNPAAGASAEVLIDGAAGDDAPQLTLLHRGAGAPLQTILAVDGGAWSTPFIALAGGADAIYGIRDDRSVHRIPGAGGAEAFALDAEDTLWLRSGSTISTLSLDAAEAESVTMPEGADPEGHDMSAAGGSVILLDAEAGSRITIDPAAQHSLLRSLSMLGDLLLLLVLIAFAGFGGHALIRNHGVF